MSNPVLLLGFGQTARAVFAALPPNTKVYATTRQPTRIFELYDYALEPIVMPVPSAEIIGPLAQNSNVLVSFPPDGSTDAVLAPACKAARAIVYISSTGVYGNRRGEITEDTEVDPTNSAAQQRLAAEGIWREAGAAILRAPGIYGPESGLHKRLLENSFAIPGDGTNVISRIHVEDLAAFVIRAWEKNVHRKTFVVGDQAPATHLETVTWLCARMGLQLPRFAPLDAVSPTLRGSRAVNAARAVSELNVTLKYPTYKEGFEALLQNKVDQV